jgi:rRNA maturation endonuclease Nob1
MLYIHHCQNCNRIHILNGHKSACPKCGQALTELPVSFLSYSSMDENARRKLTGSD